MNHIRNIYLQRADSDGWTVMLYEEPHRIGRMAGAFNTYAEALAFIAALAEPTPEVSPFFAMTE